jgi:hypothetical protein
MRKIGRVGLLCKQGKGGLQQQDKEEDDMLGHNNSLFRKNNIFV